LNAGEIEELTLEQKKERLALKWFSDGVYAGSFLRGVKEGSPEEIAKIFSVVCESEEGKEYAKSVGVHVSGDGKIDIGGLFVFDVSAIEKFTRSSEEKAAAVIVGEVNKQALKICTVIEILDRAESLGEWQKVFYDSFVNVRGFKEKFLHPSIFATGFKKAVTVDDKMKVAEMMVQFDVMPEEEVFEAMFYGFKTYGECENLREAISKDGTYSRFNQSSFYERWMRRIDKFEDDDYSIDSDDVVSKKVTAKVSVFMKEAEVGFKISASTVLILFENMSDKDFEYLLDSFNGNKTFFDLMGQFQFVVPLVLQTDSSAKRLAILHWIIGATDPDQTGVSEGKKRGISVREGLIKVIFSMCDDAQSCCSLLPFIRSISRAKELPDFYFEKAMHITIGKTVGLVVLIDWLVKKKGIVLDDRMISACKSARTVSGFLSALGVDDREGFPLTDEQERSVNEAVWHFVSAKGEEKERRMKELCSGRSRRDEIPDFSALGKKADDRETDALIKKIEGEDKTSSLDVAEDLVRRQRDEGLLSPVSDILLILFAFKDNKLPIPIRVIESLQLHPVLCVLIDKWWEWSRKAKEPHAISDFLEWRKNGKSCYDKTMLKLAEKVYMGLLYATKPYEYFAECVNVNDFMVMVEKMFDDGVEPSCEAIEALRFGGHTHLSATAAKIELEKFFALPELYQDGETIDIAAEHALYRTGVPFEAGNGWLKLYGKCSDEVDRVGNVGAVHRFKKLFSVLCNDFDAQAKNREEKKEFYQTADVVEFVMGFDGLKSKRDFNEAAEVFSKVCKERGYDTESEGSPWKNALEYLFGKAGVERGACQEKIDKVALFAGEVERVYGEDGVVSAQELVIRFGLQGTQVAKASRALESFLAGRRSGGRPEWAVVLKELADMAKAAKRDLLKKRK
jgi:hypothetical protein